MLYSNLTKNTEIVALEDADTADLIQQETRRQMTYVPLIPSENLVSEAVAAALSSAFTNKYAEGYPHVWKNGIKEDKNGRYYQGQAHTNALETLVIKRALDLFTDTPDNYHANVQPLSGAPANLAVLSAFLSPGDTFLGLSLDDGGHLTHGHKVSITSHIYKAVQYNLTSDNTLDYDQIEQLAQQHKPKLIFSGATAYPKLIDFERFGKIAHSIGALLVADISHIAGLCITGQHPHPFPHADIITTTTHKILRGPRAGLIVCKKELGEKIDKAIFPGLQGGPHMNTLAALAVAFKEAQSDAYKLYAKQVVLNAKTLANALINQGFKLVGNGTENHLILLDVTHPDATLKAVNGSWLAEKWEHAHIVANKNAIPGDKKPWIPSGIRLGTPAVTTLGMKEADMVKLADFMAEATKHADDENALTKIGAQVEHFMLQFTGTKNPVATHKN